MRVSDLLFELPEELIAQQPVEPRDASRLLALDREAGEITHGTFRDVLRYFKAGDCLVLNETQVVPARFFARRATGGRIEGLFLSVYDDGCWEVLLKPSSRLKVGETLVTSPGGYPLEIVKSCGSGRWRLRLGVDESVWDVLDLIGMTPLPPYINRQGIDEQNASASVMAAEDGKNAEECGAVASQDASDRVRYQTVYASSPGAVAAPTAGLHFTPELLGELEGMGVSLARVTLHVGMGTFKPVSVEHLADHDIHEETYELSASTADQLNATRAAGGRIICVGTTSVRTVETCADDEGVVHAGAGRTKLFIYPPYRYKAVDGMVTNFHLPGSTLLALVFALADRDLIMKAYGEAIAERYRFYSYGDAMLIV